MNDLNSKGKLRVKGMLTGASFNRKKVLRKMRELTEMPQATRPLLANGMPDFTVHCKENSPFDSANRKYALLERGEAKIHGLLSRFKVK